VTSPTSVPILTERKGRKKAQSPRYGSRTGTSRATRATRATRARARLLHDFFSYLYSCSVIDDAIGVESQKDIGCPGLPELPELLELLELLELDSMISFRISTRVLSYDR
jgi:hypothetical protein